MISIFFLVACTLAYQSSYDAHKIAVAFELLEAIYIRMSFSNYIRITFVIATRTFI